MVIEGDYFLQVEFRTQTGIPADNIVNTYAFQWIGGGAPAFEDLAHAVEDFYSALGSAALLSNVLAQNALAHQIKIYDLTDPAPRPPVYLTNFTQSGSSGALPAEVAICSSFQGTQEAGHSQARRRGRTFIGPLRTQAIENGSDGYPRPSSVARTAIANASVALLQDVVALDWVWCVWSRTDDVLYTVTNGWVEDEFDTQRRRGPGPLTRTTWTAAG